jgi:hypothetical protein
MKYFLLVTCLILKLGPLHGQNINWNAPIDISLSQYGNNHPRIVLDANGDPLVLWGNSMTNEAYFSRWNGSSFTTPVALNPSSIPVFTASWAGPDIAAYGDSIYILYKQTPEDSNHIYITTSYDGGVNFSAPVSVDSIDTKISRFPTVTVDSIGNPLVGFMRFDPMWTNPQYAVCRSSDFGNTFSSEVLASGFSGGQVCDCCPAALVSKSGFTAILYRDNLSNIRNTWAGISTDGGATFANGIAVDQTNWPYNSCPASGPDGIIIGDSLYTVFMSGATGDFLVYYSISSLANLTSGISIPVTGLTAGLNEQNYPRIANAGNAVAVAWLQNSNNSYRIMFQFTSDILTGFPTQIDTITSGGQLANTDVAVSPGAVHIIWENSTTGTVKYQKGTYITTDLSDPINNFEMQLSPNPASDFVRVKIENEKQRQINIEIFNLTGQIVYHQDNIDKSQIIHISELSAGVYVIKLSIDGSSKFKKLVIE